MVITCWYWKKLNCHWIQEIYGLNFSSNLNISDTLDTLEHYRFHWKPALLISVVFYIHVLFCITDSMKNIAFTVAMSSPRSSQPNKKIIYDKILVNIGNGYSPTTGVFTCPNDGVYVFTWSTMNVGDTCYTFIYRNGVQYLMSHSQESGGSLFEAASNTEVFHLNKGDSVWIQTATCGAFHGYPYTAFSGWKL